MVSFATADFFSYYNESRIIFKWEPLEGIKQNFCKYDNAVDMCDTARHLLTINPMRLAAVPNRSGVYFLSPSLVSKELQEQLK